MNIRGLPELSSRSYHLPLAENINITKIQIIFLICKYGRIDLQVLEIKLFPFTRSVTNTYRSTCIHRLDFLCSRQGRACSG